MTAARQFHAWIRLSLCESIAAATWNHWLAELHAAGLSLEDFLELPEHEARPYLQNWPTIARALRHEAPSAQRIDDLARQMEQADIRLIPITDPHYPARLLRDLDFGAPPFLYVRGRIGHWRAPSVAMVGTRQPSPEGLESARAYAGALVRRGLHVVSGHARGIDTAAHEGALAAAGSTTLVLSHGIFLHEPAPSIRHLATPDNTLVVSQFAPEAPMRRYLPVQRNVTVASLADGLIVVESRLVGGPSYTFREARRLRKPLWTVIFPEPVPPSAQGNHSLLSAGAQRLEPGADGAERCAAEVAKRLRAVHAEQSPTAKWPPTASPGQEELF